MSDLLSFQEQFAAALEHPALVPATKPILRRAIRIHRNTAMKAAQDALADNYPVCRALVGQDAFNACATDYVEANPPCDPRLCIYGEQFDTFVRGYVPFRGLPWLAGVARLERLRIEALFAADAPPLSSAPAQFDVDTRLWPHPAARMLPYDAPIATLWLAHQSWAAPGAIERVEWRPEVALVTRPANEVIVTPADPGMTEFFLACERGESLGDAALAANEACGDTAKAFVALIVAGAFLTPEWSIS